MSCALRSALLNESFIETRGGHRVSKEDSGLCGVRPAYAAGPRQLAQLDRAGPWARTRFRLRAGFGRCLEFIACGIRIPTIERIALDCTEDTLAQAVILLFQHLEQVFDLLTLGITVSRAGVMHNRQIITGCK